MDKSIEIEMNDLYHAIELHQQKTDQEMHHIKQQLDTIRTSQQEGVTMVKRYMEKNENFHGLIDKRVNTVEVKAMERDRLFSTVTKLIWGAAILGLSAFVAQLGQVFLVMLD